jgi:hypothetical protein
MKYEYMIWFKIFIWNEDTSFRILWNISLAESAQILVHFLYARLVTVYFKRTESDVAFFFFEFVEIRMIFQKKGNKNAFKNIAYIPSEWKLNVPAYPRISLALLQLTE